MGELVTIGVPVYRGEQFLEEALHSIQAQTHREFEAILSFDGPDPACEAICGRFLSDSRFRLVVQPRRLGWIGNINWLMSQAAGSSWYFHQQDDLVAPEYVATLLEHLRQHPEATLACADVVPFGRIEGRLAQAPSICGTTAFMRQMAVLHQHLPAFAFRGVTRIEAVQAAGGVPDNEIDGFGADIVWVARIALAGEVHRVPVELYRKRYHGANTASRWDRWGREQRLEAWPRHCWQMLEQALHAGGTAQELRLLWLAGVERLTSPEAAAHLLPLGELTAPERAAMLESLIACAMASRTHDVPVLLDAGWDEICRWSRGFYWIPREDPVEITAFGPATAVLGRPFNQQPDGSSAVWAMTSRRPAPGARLRLSGVPLETVVDGTLLTATVPPALLAGPGRLELVVVFRDGSPRSPVVTLEVVEP